MPFNGSGTFAALYSWVNDYNAGKPISPTEFDQYGADMAAGLSNAMTLDGQSTVKADLPMNGHGFTGLRDPAAPQEAATKNYVDAATANVSKLNASTPFTAAQTISMTGPALILNYPALVQWAQKIDPDGRFRLYGNSTPILAAWVDGSFWTAQLGDLSTRIESRASAYAGAAQSAAQSYALNVANSAASNAANTAQSNAQNYAYQNFASGGRLSGAYDFDQSVPRYNGSVMVGIGGSHVYYKYIQLLINGSWVTVGEA